MPELIAILAAKADKENDNRKFFAAIQGIDLGGKSDRGQKEWEDMKARVMSKGKVNDSNDVVSLQGFNAKKAGFGIGNGLEYSSNSPKNPMG